jgi:hypothetical protein
LNIFSTNAVLRPLGLTGILFRHYWRNSFSPVRGLLWGTILSNEITSSAVPSNFERAKGVLSAIAFLGCRVYLIAVLLIASSLKIAPLFHDVGFNWNWDNVGFGAIAIVELFVALLVIGFYNFKPALIVVAGLFLILAGVSSYFFVQRVPTCGCFGRIQTPPIFSLSISLIALGAVAFLIRASITKRGIVRTASSMRSSLGLYLSVGFAIAVAVALELSIGGVIRKLNAGEYLLVTDVRPPEVELNPLTGIDTQIEVDVKNISSGTPIDVLGCVSLSGIAQCTSASCPIRIGPGEIRTIRVRCEINGLPENVWQDMIAEEARSLLNLGSESMLNKSKTVQIRLVANDFERSSSIARLEINLDEDVKNAIREASTRD